MMLVTLLFFYGILSVTGYFDIVGKSIEVGGLQSFFNEFNGKNLVDTQKMDCSENCSKNKPVPIVIWFFCC